MYEGSHFAKEMIKAHSEEMRFQRKLVLAYTLWINKNVDRMSMSIVITAKDFINDHSLTKIQK